MLKIAVVDEKKKTKLKVPGIIIPERTKIFPNARYISEFCTRAKQKWFVQIIWYKIKCTNNAEFFVEVFWKKDRMKFNDKAIIAYQIKDQNQHL